MRWLLVIVCLALLSGKSAVAADLPVKAPYYPYQYPSFDWAGTYIGVSSGVTSGGLHGGVATLTFGLNFPTYSSFVLGVEGDFSFSNRSATGGCVGCDFDGRWFSTARIRAGYSLGRALIFGTGGFAFGKIEASAPTASSAETKMGYALGAGLDFDMAHDWSLRAEYLHVDFGRFDCGVACGALALRTSSEVVRLGLIFRFFQEPIQEFTFGGYGTKRPPPR